ADLHLGFRGLMGRIERLQRLGRIRLVTANGLWLQEGYPFSTKFVSLARTDYRAAAEKADFIGAAGPASGRINRWVEKRTNGRIKAMLSMGQVNQESRLVLCNAIYF